MMTFGTFEIIILAVITFFILVGLTFAMSIYKNKKS